MTNRQYKINSRGKQLGIGVAGSEYVSLNAISKSNVPSAPYCIPNELICCELGRFIGLPVPPVAIVAQAGGVSSFASLDFNLAGNTLPPVDIGRCLQQLPQLSAGLLLFDIWVANLDRHPGNFSVDFLANPAQMNVFDHSHALFGYHDKQGETRLAALADRLGVSWKTGDSAASGSHKHCILEAITTDEHFGYWIDRIKSTPEFFIRDRCAAALGNGATQPEVDAAIGFILQRRDGLSLIVNKHQAEFSAIKSWRLFQ